MSDDKGSPWDPNQGGPGQGYQPYPGQGSGGGPAYPQNPGYPSPYPQNPEYPPQSQGYPQGPGPGYPPSGQGYPPPGYGPYGGGQPRNGLGIAALVLGIAAILLSWTVIGGILLGVAALICGFLGRGRVKRHEANNGGIALAGIITGAFGAAIALIVLVLFVAVFASDGRTYINCLQDAGNNQLAIDQCAREFERDLSGG